MSDLPLCSSDQIIRALERAGFQAAHTSGRNAKGGSHRTDVRERADGGSDVTVVVLNKREAPRGTLRSILRLASLTADEFLDRLR